MSRYSFLLRVLLSNVWHFRLVQSFAAALVIALLIFAVWGLHWIGMALLVLPDGTLSPLGVELRAGIADHGNIHVFALITGALSIGILGVIICGGVFLVMALYDRAGEFLENMYKLDAND